MHQYTVLICHRVTEGEHDFQINTSSDKKVTRLGNINAIPRSSHVNWRLASLTTDISENEWVWSTLNISSIGVISNIRPITGWDALISGNATQDMYDRIPGLYRTQEFETRVGKEYPHIHRIKID